MGECCLAGVDSAQWLCSQTKIAGTVQSCARLSDSWNVADVGRTVAEERDRDARLAAHLEGEARADDRREPAADDRVRAQVPALDVVEVHRAAVPVAAALDLPVELRHDLVRMRALGERVPVRAVGRGDHVALLQRPADADRDGLLADGDVQEARQLAGAEALLDLLLETPDQEHLPEEVLEAFRGHGLTLLLERCHGADKLAARVNNLRVSWPSQIVSTRSSAGFRAAGSARAWS